MQYRYFASSFNEVVEQFQNNYGKENILFAEKQKDFENILLNLKQYKKQYKAIVLEAFLFFDILTEDNIYQIKSLEKYFEYIVFSGKNIDQLILKIKKFVK